MKHIYKLLGIHGFTYYRVNKRWILISNPAEQKETTMTVKQLIDALSKIPPSATVYTEDGEGHDYCVINEIDFSAKITE